MQRANEIHSVRSRNEQLRHRLTNLIPQGRRCSVDQNTLKRTDLDDFVACYNPKNRHERKPTWSDKNDKGRWRAYSYEDLIERDKINLDILTPCFPARRPRGPGLILRSQRIQVWLIDEALEDSANLPDPGVLALEITEDLEAALTQFAEIANDLKK